MMLLRRLHLLFVLTLPSFLPLFVGAVESDSSSALSASPTSDVFSTPDSEPSRGPFLPTATPSIQSVTTTETILTSISDFPDASESTFAMPTPLRSTAHPTSLPAGAVIAASIGGSLAVSLLMLAGAALLMHHRPLRILPSRSAVPDDELSTAATVAGTQSPAHLEAELRLLRQRVERLEVALASQRRTSGGGVMYYVNEKDGETLAGGSDDGALPKYFD